MGLRHALRDRFLSSNTQMMCRSAHATAVAMAEEKCANFGMLSGIAKSLVVFGILVGLGIITLVKFRDTQTVGSTAYNELDAIIALFTDLRVWAGIVLIVIIGYVILRYMDAFGN